MTELILSIDEQHELERCEVVIKQGLETFVEVGNALMIIRDKRLYRNDYQRFEDYCQEKWDLQRRHAYRLIDAAQVFENVSHGTQTLPESERQARPLTKLEPELQAAAWQSVTEQNPDGITAKVVEQTVQDFSPINDQFKHEKQIIESNAIFKTEAEIQQEVEIRAQQLIEKRRLEKEEATALWKYEQLKDRKAKIEIVKNISLENVFHGDARDVLPTIPQGIIKCVITDPPYGMNFISNRRTESAKDLGIANDENMELALDLVTSVFSELYEKMADDACLFCFIGWKQEPEFRNAISDCGFKIKNSLIWVKNNHGSGDIYGAFAPKHERIIFAVKGNPKLSFRYPDVLNGSDIRTDHSTSKPIDLIKVFIEATTIIGEVVCDPFAGHGSVGIACQETNRPFYLIELDEYNYSEIKTNLNAH